MVRSLSKVLILEKPGLSQHSAKENTGICEYAAPLHLVAIFNFTLLQSNVLIMILVTGTITNSVP